MKEAPESRTHGDVPDCVEGGCSVREASVIEPAVPVEEEPEAASRRLSLRISWSVKAMAEAVEVDDKVPEDDDRALRRCFFFV